MPDKKIREVNFKLSFAVDINKIRLAKKILII